MDSSVCRTVCRLCGRLAETKRMQGVSGTLQEPGSLSKRSPALLGTGPTPGYREILRPMWEAALVFVSSCLRTIVLQTYSFFSSSK
jgi:hypothetical protein